MHTLHGTTHRILFHHEWNPEIIEYYFYLLFSKIGLALAAIFVPVFLYAELNYSLAEIALFWIINQIFFLISVPFSSKLIEKIGVKHTTVIYLPFMAIFLYCLRLLSPGFWENIGLVVLLLAIRAIPKSTHPTAETVFIAKNILNSKKYGNPLAKIRIVVIIATLLAPLCGGLITHFFGFEMLFNFAILFFLLAMVPLLLTKDEHFEVKIRPKQIWDFTLHKMSKNFLHAELGRTFANTALWLLWPLFLYIIVRNTLDLGTIITASGIISLLVAYKIGNWVDKYESKNLLKGSVKVATGIYYLRTVFANPFLIAFTDIINKVFEPVFIVPYERYVFKYINSFPDVVEASCGRILISEVGAVAGFAMAALIFFLAPIFGIPESSPIVFFILFLVLGLAILLMSRITNVASID